MTRVVESIQQVAPELGDSSSASSEPSAGVAQVGDAVFKLDAGDSVNRASPEPVNSPIHQPMLTANETLNAPSRDALVAALAPFALSKT